MVAQQCNPSYLRGLGGLLSETGEAKEHLSKNKLKAKEWGCGSSGQVLAQQVKTMS